VVGSQRRFAHELGVYLEIAARYVGLARTAAANPANSITASHSPGPDPPVFEPGHFDLRARWPAQLL